MITIGAKVWSHKTSSIRSKKYVSEVRKSGLKTVRSYSKLIEHIALINYQNNRLFVFYRAQPREHYTRGKVRSNTSVFPSIYRDKGVPLTSTDISQRYANLDYGVKVLQKMLPRNRNYPTDKLKKYPELAWSILQHYEVCQTPLLDITQSLLVAASFALQRQQEGILYVFGLPMITNGISYSIEDELLNIKLSSSCPPQAKRPFHQEAYLMGNFPARKERRDQQQDCAKRLVAKFRLVDSGNFFDGGFSLLSQNALYPNQNDWLYHQLKAKMIGFPFPSQLP
jgi:hypothetical protein